MNSVDSLICGVDAGLGLFALINAFVSKNYDVY